MTEDFVKFRKNKKYYRFHGVLKLEYKVKNGHKNNPSSTGAGTTLNALKSN